MLACAPLLPPPGDTELAALARAYLKLHDEHEALKKDCQGESKTPAGFSGCEVHPVPFNEHVTRVADGHHVAHSVRIVSIGK